MFQLATEYWKKENVETSLSYCRIEWIKKKCKHYFLYGGMKKFDDKEEYLIRKDRVESNQTLEEKKIETLIDSKINILDVGSCYNPFKTEDLFSVTAVDLAPYSEDVVKCDFLNLKVDSARIFSDKSLLELPKNSFDAVIFSLLLEYIPCPEKRFSCCQKAYDLLKEGGILFIVTPDSKHEGANSKIINTSWKIVLAKLGFMRIYYEKLPHIHCLGFRKCFYSNAALKRINWKKIPENDEIFSSMKIFIPQDFQTKNTQEKKINSNCSPHNDQEVINLFNELACID